MKRNCLFYFLLLLLSLMPALFLNNLYGYLPFLFFTFLTIISALYALLLRVCFKSADITESYSCERDKELAFTLQVKNKSFLIFPKIEASFYISDSFGNENYVQEVSYILAPFEMKDFLLNIRFDHVGSYQAGLKNIKIYGPMGILGFRPAAGKCFEITVTPRIYNFRDFASLTPVRTKSETSRASYLLNGTDYTGIREYQQGDPIKNIHWNLSAHSTQYLTKKYETYASYGISILLDLQAPDYQNDILMALYDCILEAALSIAHHAKKLGHQYEILYSKDGMAKRYAPPHFYKLKDFIDDLPGLSSKNGSYDVITLLTGQSGLPADSTKLFILCTSNLSRRIINTLISMKNNCRDTLLYYVLPEDLDKKEKQDKLKELACLTENHISCQVIHSAADLLMAG